MNSIDILSIAFGFASLVAIVAVYYALHYRGIANEEAESLNYWHNESLRLGDELDDKRNRISDIQDDSNELRHRYIGLSSRAYIRQGRAFRRYLTVKEY